MSNEQGIPLVLALDDASAQLEQVGGKGASISIKLRAIRVASPSHPAKVGQY